MDMLPDHRVDGVTANSNGPLFLECRVFVMV